MRIHDPNLALALLDEAQSNYSWVGALEPAYTAARAKHPKWPTWAQIVAKNETDEPAPSLEAFIRSLPLPMDRLAAVESLTLDGDREVYGWLMPYWWDLGDHFVIRDLRGIGICAALTYLSLGQGLVDGCSLKPLLDLKHLRKLSVCALTDLRDIECLTRLPALTQLEVVNVRASDQRAAWETVIAKVGSGTK